MIQETLEEVAEKEAEGRYPVLTHSNPKNSPYVGTKQTFKHGVRFGAKWQQERMYSEEEVFKILYESHNAESTSIIANTLKKWFEKYKK